AFHRSKPEASACEARTRPTIATRTAARATQTLPLTPRLRGRGGGSPEGRRRLPPPPGPRGVVTLTISPVPCARIIWPVTPPRAPERDRALRGHRKWRDTSSGWLIVRRPSSRASGMFGLERLCHGAAAAEAG